MKAMIFAAGLGTRLKPITDTMPKALVPVCGKPLLEHVVDKLKAAGITEIVINVHHFAGMIIDYIEAHGQFGINVKVSDESDGLLETGGGIQHARALLGEDENFLIHNVDIVSDLDLVWFEKQVRPDSISTILVSERNTQRYFLFDDGMRLVGWTNVATGEVTTPFANLDVSKCRKLAFAGVHCMSPEIFKAFEEFGFSGKFGIVDFYLAACAKYRIQGVIPSELKMVDVGKFDSLAQAEEIASSLLH